MATVPIILERIAGQAVERDVIPIQHGSPASQRHLRDQDGFCTAQREIMRELCGRYGRRPDNYREDQEPFLYEGTTSVRGQPSIALGPVAVYTWNMSRGTIPILAQEKAEDTSLQVTIAEHPVQGGVVIYQVASWTPLEQKRRLFDAGFYHVPTSKSASVQSLPGKQASKRRQLA